MEIKNDQWQSWTIMRTDPAFDADLEWADLFRWENEPSTILSHHEKTELAF